MAQRTSKFNHHKKARYLDLIRQGLRRGKAAEGVGVSRVWVWQTMKADAEFAAQVEQAEADACEIVEDYLLKACEKGNVVGILFWLMNRCPARWQDRRGQGVVVTEPVFTSAEREKLRELYGFHTPRPGDAARQETDATPAPATPPAASPERPEDARTLAADRPATSETRQVANPEPLPSGLVLDA